MSTRAQIRFATRQEGQSFNEHPSAIHAQFYRHHDGYPEGLGVDIAESLINKRHVNGRSWEIESLDAKHGDLEYIYYIWQAPGKETWISIFEDNSFPGYSEDGELNPSKLNKCIFVGNPQKLIDKYKLDTNNDR
tara:strand:+ start:578 stop:979 length:402 start_codon:yes stop_codon:yes gene_type:complete